MERLSFLQGQNTENTVPSNSGMLVTESYSTHGHLVWGIRTWYIIIKAQFNGHSFFLSSWCRKNFLCFGDSKIRDELQDIIKLISKLNLVGCELKAYRIGKLPFDTAWENRSDHQCWSKIKDPQIWGGSMFEVKVFTFPCVSDANSLQTTVLY